MRSENTKSVKIRKPPKLDNPERILEELSRVLKSDSFNATPRRRDMLTFLIEETLAGRADTLKGYSIGLAVFGRDESFDPQSDPIVRLEARHLRHNLDSYYIAEGANNPIRISIPKGQYVPKFHHQVEERDRHQTNALQPGRDEETSQRQNPDRLQAQTSKLFQPAWVATIAACTTVIVILGAVLSMQVIPQVRARLGSTKPWVMVVPFKIANSDPEEALLSAGIADQIMTALSGYPDYRIFLPPDGARNGDLIDPITIGQREESVFLISGSVRSEADVISVNAKLIHVASKRVLWSNTYDRMKSSSSLLDIEKNIAREIATIAGQPYGVIKTEMTDRLPTTSETDVGSFECVLRGYVYRRNFGSGLHSTVQACLEKAVARDPYYAEAWAMLGWCYLDAGRFDYGHTSSKEIYFDRALDAATHALTLDGGNILALKATSSIYHYMGNVAEGERFARLAYEINPYDPDTLAQLGWRLAIVGKFEEGIPLLETAIDRTRNAPGWYFHLIAVDHLLHDRYAEMLSAAKKATVESGTGFGWPLVVIAQSELGNKDATRLALARMAKDAPLLNHDPIAFLRRHQMDDDIIEKLMKGLIRAGWSPPKSG